MGATVNNSGGGEEDIKLRLNKARRTFRRMNQVWNSAKFSRTTKIRLYNTLVIPVLLYGAETWKMTKSNNTELDVFQGKCLRRILKIFWPKTISNDDLLTKSNCGKLSIEVMRRRWRWLGHVLRGDKENHCNTALTWAPEGKRKRGRPKINWRRTVEKERDQMGWTSWSQARKATGDREN
mgnify:FL=1